MPGRYRVDRERRIQDWDAAAEELTGYLRQDVLGRQCGADLIAHCDEEGELLCGERCPLAGVMGDGQPRELTVFLRHAAGYRVPVAVRASAVFSPAGEIAGAEESMRMLEWAEQDAAGGGVEALCGKAELVTAMLEKLSALRQRGSRFGLLVVRMTGLEELRRDCGPDVVEPLAWTIAQTVARELPEGGHLAPWGLGTLAAAVDCSAEENVKLLEVLLASLGSESSVLWWGRRVHCQVSVEHVMAEANDGLTSLLARAGLLAREETASGPTTEMDGTRLVLPAGG